MNNELFYEYQNILIGNRKMFSTIFFQGTPEANEKVALEIIRYAFEYFLRWKPEDVNRFTTKKTIESMKLENIVSYINFPGELNQHEDFYYLAHLLYPKKIPFDSKSLTIKVYKNVLEGKIKKFPKEYLDGNEGMLKACICFQYMIKKFLSFHSIQEIYEFFAGVEAVSTLKKYKLYTISINMFDTNIDYLHDSLAESQKDEFYYFYYKFKHENKTVTQAFKTKNFKKFYSK